MLTCRMGTGTSKGGKEKGGGCSDPVAEAESCCVIWVRSWFVVSLELLMRYLYPSMMKAATIAEKRAAWKKSVAAMVWRRIYGRTHEDEDSVHVALPTFHEGLIILLTLLENDAPELRGRTHVFDLCVFLWRVSSWKVAFQRH